MRLAIGLQVLMREPMIIMNSQNMRMKSMAVSSDEALPTEAGKALVTVSVNGSVQMSK